MLLTCALNQFSVRLRKRVSEMLAKNLTDGKNSAILCPDSLLTNTRLSSESDNPWRDRAYFIFHFKQSITQ
jgi:hypothetical protein